MEGQGSADMLRVIGDFLELGHVENIVLLFRQDPAYYELAGDLLRDERFMVRLGMAILFEELRKGRHREMERAVPHLLPLLAEDNALLRGEAATLLGIIGTETALAPLLPLATDPDPGVREVVTDILGPDA